jgi:sulfate adenylyltransferase subunit 2
MSSRPESSEVLNEKRRRAVEMRLAGSSLAAIRRETGLSAPTVISAYKAFVAGGWTAVPVKGLGRRVGQGRRLLPEQEQALREVIFKAPPAAQGLANPLWSVGAVQAFLRARWSLNLAESTVLRYLAGWGLNLQPLRDVHPANATDRRWLTDELPRHLNRARSRREKIFWAGQLAPGDAGTRLLCGTSLRGRPTWLPLMAPNRAGEYIAFLDQLLQEAGSPVCVLLHGVGVGDSPELAGWIAARADRLTVIPCPIGLTRALDDTATPPKSAAAAAPKTARAAALQPAPDRGSSMTLTHLQRLEAEAIHIMREVVAEAEKPVMLYSIGKDSACMLRLAQKAFFPGVPPFPLLHVDTTWKFREMYELRDRVARETGMELIVHRNPEALEQGINPFEHGSQIHTDMWKTQGLKQALEKYGFDAAFGGARRDEEKSRAKERIFSFRNAQHRWDPKAQRPELWRLYNSRKRPGETIRVFPLSNWTELDVWQYIHQEKIPVVPLYFAQERPVVQRDGAWIMVDDERMPLKPGEVPVMRRIRFRTLGCYPLSGGVESDADSVTAVIREMLLSRTSERQGRLIDHDQSASMEKKKQEGYF